MATIQDFKFQLRRFFFRHSYDNVVPGIPRTIAITDSGPYVSQPRHFKIELSIPTHDRRLLQFWKFYVREIVLAIRELLRGIGKCNFQVLLMSDDGLIDPSGNILSNINNNYDININDQISNLIEAIENSETAFGQEGAQGMMGELQQGFLGDESDFNDWTNSGNTYLLNTANFDIRNCNLVYKMYFAINDDVNLTYAFNNFFRSLQANFSTRLDDYITNRANSIDIELDNPDIVRNENELIENQNNDDDDDDDDDDDNDNNNDLQDDAEIISDVEPDEQLSDNEEQPLVVPLTNRLARIRRDPRTLIAHEQRSGPYGLRTIRRLNPKVYTFQKHNRIHIGRGLKAPRWMRNLWSESTSTKLERKSLKNLKAQRLAILQRKKRRR